MYTRILIPLDGSKTAEKALPHGRFLANRLKLPVELLEVIDVVDVGTRLSPENAHLLPKVLEHVMGKAEQYLKGVAGTFPGVDVTYAVEKGRGVAQIVIEKAAQEKGTLINMATHGHSGINRWLLGSVAEKVLRGVTNPVFLVRATEAAKTEGDANLRSAIVPLDGSQVAEQVLPPVVELAKRLKLELILFRTYRVPYTAYVPVEGYYPADHQLVTKIRDEALAYLEHKAEALKQSGVEKISCIAKEGFAGDEIIALGRETSDNLIAMCTHGRTGVQRWVLGSVTETVVRHSADPVLVVRATQ